MFTLPSRSANVAAGRRAAAAIMSSSFSGASYIDARRKITREIRIVIIDWKKNPTKEQIFFAIKTVIEPSMVVCGL